MLREVKFEELQSSDLSVGTVYRSGTEGTVADDPIARIAPVGNQGGFRYKGSPVRNTVRLVAMFTTGNEAEWPDHLEPSTGILTYYGDNRRPGQQLLDTRRKGNVLLRHAFAAAYGSRLERSHVPPFLLFEKAADRGRDVRFRGLLAPGVAGSSIDSDLHAVWRESPGGKFENYQARFTLLNVMTVSRAWIDAVANGIEPLEAPGCPCPWRVWVETRSYDMLRA
ncbi:hypothetical protein [Mycolicibacterium goodii]|uniref:hypothetical protein n=1 Tax=Mycolicibacterium goodii TaxID=134601 RepID=UPI001BDC595A|nr:hypothetical protein [Mycolicibacterium goodii]